ncbi:hypothetical protein EC036_09610 [Enterobacter cloacae]|nr:hypothetical protein EC036_09610 [Enterobacter cloacae]
MKKPWLIMRTKKHQPYKIHSRFALLQNKRASNSWPVER